VEIRLLTPEEAPLGVFGHSGSEAVASLLADKGIELLSGVHADRFDEGLVHLVPGAPVRADRAIALPGLRGIPIGGVPADGSGFVHVNAVCRVKDLDDVYAAGDGTSFPVKQGGLAAQMADAAASAIAATAGASVELAPFDPVLRGLLLTGTEPTYLRAEIGGGHMYASTAGESPLWWPAGKIAARYLSPYLAEHTGLAFGAFGQRSDYA
jgi:sulfide:quinone oxidoreductase